ncbi:MAG: choice-of-anchor L domain-containing protein [Chitinophagaceae bacterium]|nr:choice-of-anchor L domain-containing protein [Chitinophagaceae bacterium]
MPTLRHLLISFCFLFSFHTGFAQLVVTNNQTANQLVDRLVGQGIVYTNPVLTCPAGASGKFDNGLVTTIAMDTGIVLTTGIAATTYFLGIPWDIGVNESAAEFASWDNLMIGGDLDLQNAASSTIYDLCKLEFDFVPIGDTIKFNYRFGSEEYPLYTCSNFNDIFSFFISGPGYAVPTNLALIPGTNCPVSINTINGSTLNPCGTVTSPCAPPNNALFIDNTFGTNITYDGLTQQLTAIAPVTPCSTYHMKFAIADVFDGILDSGVFLEAGSFQSEAAIVSGVTSSNNIAAANPFAIEGCNGSVVTIKRPNPKPFPQNVPLVYSGTATIGLDCNALPASVTIPANDTVVSFTIFANADALAEGVETIIIDVYGSVCATSVTDQVTVEILETPGFTISPATTICQGSSTVMNATPVPANNNFTFTWSPLTTPSSGNVVSASPGVTTTYTVTAAYPGCPSVDSFIAITISPLPVPNLTPVNISCGSGTGSITASASGTGLSFTLQPGNIVQAGSPTTFTGLSAGSYTITASNSNSCTGSAITSISATTGLNWASINPTNITCNNPNSGQINALVNGGTLPVNYTLLPGSLTNTTGVFSGLTAQTYTINAVDANLCTATTIVTLTQQIPPVFNTLSPTNPTCFNQTNGSVLTGASSANGAITYTLNPGGASNTTGSFNGLGNGGYTVQATDASGCTATTTFNLTQPTPLIWTSTTTTNISCNGSANGTITTTASGGTGSINYILQPGNISNTTGSFSGLNASTFTITASDANNCTTSTTITLSQPTLLNIINVSTTTPTCTPGNDATAVIVATGATPAYTYSVGGPTQASNSINNLGAGNYTVVVTDANGCTATSAFTVNAPIGLTWSTTSSTPVSCFGLANGQINVSASGGLGTITYTRNPGGVNNTNGIFGGLAAGTYTITASDIANCTNSTIIVVTQPTAVIPVSLNSVSPNCFGSATGSVTAVFSGGTPAYNFTLQPLGTNNTTGTFNNLNAATYTVLATDANGCTSTSSIVMTQPAPIVWSQVNTNNISCNGGTNGSISVTATGGIGSLIFNLQPGNITNTNGNFNNLVVGNYTITATDANACSTTTLVALQQAPLLTITAVNTTTPSCIPGNDATAIILVNGGTPAYNYSIGGPLQGANNFNNLSNGNYTVTVGDANNCTATSAFIINPPAPVTWTTVNVTNITCNGFQNGQISATASGGQGLLTYTLMPGNLTNTNGQYNSLAPGNYTISVSDAANCANSTIVTITEPAALTFLNLNTVDPSCFNSNNGIANVSYNGGTGALNYTLLPGGTSNTTGNFSSLPAGIYTIQVSDANNCTAQTFFTLIDPPAIVISTIIVNHTGCNPDNTGSISVVASGGAGTLTYSIGGAFVPAFGFTGMTAGNYTVVVKDGNGCTTSSVVTILTPPNPTFISTQTTPITCHGDNNATVIALADGVNPVNSYIMNPGNLIMTGGSIDSLAANTYTITATDTKGCTTTSIVTIDDPEAVVISSVETDNLICQDNKSGKIRVTASGGTGNLSYYLLPQGSYSSTGQFSYLAATTYSILVTDARGCSATNIATLEQEACCTKIFVPNAFSPNGDLNNDEFRMVNAYGIDLKTFIIVNRWGNIVFESTNPDVGWNGKYKLQDVESGTYFYMIKYTCLSTGVDYFLKGDLILVR